MGAIEQIPKMLELAREAARLAEEFAAIEPRISGDLAEVPQLLISECQQIESLLESYMGPNYQNYSKQQLFGHMGHDLARIRSASDGLDFMTSYSDFAITPAHMAKLKQLAEPLEKLHAWYLALRKEAYPGYE
jgi:hypothetical protein